MQSWQDKLIQKYLKEKSDRDKLQDRLFHQPQGDIDDRQWVKMHYQLDALNRYVSCLYARVKEFMPNA